MFSGSVVYAPGDTYPGETRPATRDAVPSSWTPRPILATPASAIGVTAAVAIGLLWFVGRRKK